MAAVYLAAVSLCNSSLRDLICSASITCKPKPFLSISMNGSIVKADPRTTHPLRSVVEHLLPRRVELPLVVLQQPLFGQSDGLLGRTQHLSGPLEVLCGPLCFQLSLERKKTADLSEISARDDSQLSIAIQHSAGRCWQILINPAQSWMKIMNLFSLPEPFHQTHHE